MEDQHENEAKANGMKLGRKRSIKQSVIFGLIKNYSNPDHVPFKDKMTINPIERYRIYGKFPVRMVLDIVLVVLSTIQIVMINGSTSSYIRAVERFFYDIFLQNDSPYEINYSKIKYLYNMDEIIETFKKSKSDYLNLENFSLGNLTMVRQGDNVQIPILIDYLYHKDNSNNNGKDLIEEYTMTKDDLWIFNDSLSKQDIKKELLRIKSFIIQYKVKTFEAYNFGQYHECFNWNVEQIFSFEKRYHYSMSLNILYSSCDDYSHDGNVFIKGSYWIPTLLVIFSLTNFIFTLRSIAINYKYYMNFKYRYSKSFVEIERENKPLKRKRKWEMLRGKDKGNLISKSNYLQAVTCLVLLFGGTLILYEGQDVIVITRYIVGLGAALAYISLTKYLDFYYQFHTVFMTIIKSIPNIILYFFGTLPIFLSFTTFGVVNFPFSERFSSFPRVILSLFGMMNGDSILDITTDLINNNYFLGQIYVYTFNILFICVVINIFVSIIEEAFVNAKLKNQNHWIYSFVKKNQQKEEEDEAKGVTREQMKMYEEMRRKIMIRNVLNQNKSKEIKKQTNESSLDISNDSEMINAKPKKRAIKEIDIFVNNLQEATKEIKKVKNEIEECKESKMKYELNEFLTQKISRLEKLILNIKNSL